MDNINVEQETPAKRSHKTPGTVDKSKALALRLNNKLTYQQIADIQGVTKQAIHTAISELMPKEETKTYLENRADILANVQIKQLEAFNSLTPDEQKELIKRRGLVDYGIVYDKEVIARGGTLGRDTMPLVTINQVIHVAKE